MGKVFDDKIINYLCTKNVKKIQEGQKYPPVKCENSGIRRGETYVVSLNKNQRSLLIQQMGGGAVADHQPNVKPETDVPLQLQSQNAESQTDESGVAPQPQSFFKRRQMRRRLRQMEKTARTLMIATEEKNSSDSIDTAVLEEPDWVEVNSHVRTGTVIWGPFVDEIICFCVDRVLYFFATVFSIFHPKQ